MGKLSDILRGGAETLQSAWDTTEAAGEFGPLPTGEYVARIIRGELENSKSNETPGYKLEFRIIEGDFVDRRFWHDIWLTAAALPMAKRDLLKLGVSKLEQLESPIPQGIRCRVKLALRRDDKGAEFNRVVRFDLLGIDAPEVDPFAPADSAEPAVGNESGEGASDE